MKETRLKELVNSLFDDFLDYTETKGLEDRVIHPISITCCRVLKTQPLAELLAEMRKLAKE